MQEELAGRAARLDAALRHAHLELRDPGAAGGVLEVGELVVVVGDAVAADLLRRQSGALAVVGPRAVIEATDERATRAAAGERAAGAAATRDVAVAGLAWIDDAVAAHRARIGQDAAATGTRPLVGATRVLALDGLQVLADDL